MPSFEHLCYSIPCKLTITGQNEGCSQQWQTHTTLIACLLSIYIEHQQTTITLC